MTISINGSGTITGLVAGGLPDASITAAELASGAARTNFGAGAVLQVLQVSTNTTTSTTSTTFTDATGLSLAITPSSASSKILVLCDLAYYNQADNATYFGVQIVRNGTAVLTNNYFSGLNVNANIATYTHGTFNYLDSPETVSAVTYKIQIKRSSSAGTSYAPSINGSSSNQSSTITLLEIAG